MLRTRLLPAILVLLTAVGGPGTAGAQGERAEGPTPPRLATMDGDVSFWRPGADDWAPAQINTALAAGDRLYTGSEGSVGLELAQRAWVRVDRDTEIGLASLETGYLQLELTSGRAALDLQRLPDGQRVEVDTPNGAFMVDRAGYYRFDVGDDTTFTVRRGGEATVIPAGGDDTVVRDGEQVVLTGTDSATLVNNRAPAPDTFDQANDRLFAGRPAQARSAQYVPPDVAGADELDDHGDWRATRDYGQVWVPRDTGPDWAPYTTGRWVYDPYYEWTWVDDAPWGWAPYHYGRWVYYDNYWGWAPGPIVARPVYAPALVGFVDAPGVSLSISVGAPFVGWVALGWGEPCLPWWGPHGFRARPWWGGWRGPRYVNNVYIDNRRIVNGRHINRYRNFDARNGVVGVRRDHFGRGRDHVRLARNDVGRLQPIRGTLGVKPVSASLVPRTGRGRRPPDRSRSRAVVATRAPQDTSRRLQRAGLTAPRERGSQVRVQGPRSNRLGEHRDGPQRLAGRDRQQRPGGAPPPPRAERRERADGRGRPDAPAAGVSPERARRDAPDRNRPGRGAGGEDARRVGRGADRRGDAALPQPRAERRPAPPQHTDRSGQRSPRVERDRAAPRAERRQAQPVPRAERQHRSVERMAPQRRDGGERSARPGRERRDVAPPRERANPTGGTEARRDRAAPSGAPAPRPRVRSQPPGGGQAAARGGARGDGGGRSSQQGRARGGEGGRQREGREG